MDKPARTLPDGTPLPDGLVREAILAQRPESLVLKVRDGDRPLVLRVFPAADDLGLLAGRLARIRHPHLALPERWGTTASGGAWVARPFHEGQTLEAASPLSGEALARVASEVLLGLEALHDHGLVHRDLKPANVLLTESGALLIDMDLVGVASEGRGAGTPGFLAPEVLGGSAARPASDLFALGVTVVHGAGLLPDRGLELRFPASSWWEAARLDPAQLPAEVRPFVEAAVHRSPGARPLDARSARLLLPGAPQGLRQIPPLPDLPSDAARIHQAARLLQDGGSVLVRVAFPEDLEPAQRALQAAAVQLGLRPELLSAAAVADLARPQRGHRIVLARPRLSTEALAADVVRRTESPTAWVVGPEHGAALGDQVRQAGVRCAVVEVGLVETRELAAHLDSATGHSQPAAAAALARDLCERSGGRASVLSLALRNAVEVGAAEVQGDGLVLRADRWPSPLEATGPALPEDPEAVALVQALAVLGRAIAAEPLAQVLDRPLNDVEQTALVLRRAGWLGQDGRGLVTLGSGLVAEAASASLEPRTRIALAARWLSADAQLTAVERAELRLAAGLELDQVAAEAVRLASEGRAATAQRLADGLLANDGQHQAMTAAVRESAAVLSGRLLLARGNRAGAAMLFEVDGVLAGARSNPALLLRAELTENADEAARLRAAALQEPSATAPERDRARIAEAHAQYLAGKPAEVDSLLDALEEPEPDTAGTAAMLRFACAAGRADWDSAKAALDAIPAEHLNRLPSLRGRAALNRAFMARRRAHLPEAIRSLREAEAAFALCDDRRQEALAANNLGVVLRDAGELVEARRSLNRALRLRRQLGDAHGEGSTLGSLALVELEAGHLTRASSGVREAARVLESGGHARELQALAPARLLVNLFLRGPSAARGADLARTLAAARAHARGAVARALAELALSEGRRSAGLRLLRLGAAAAEGTDEAERFRCTARLASLGAGSREALEALAGQLGEGRVLEARWRGARPLGAEELLALLAQVQARGRTDLAAALARSLVRAAAASGDADGRRRAAARLEEARRQLTEGLEEALADQHFERATLAAGWQPGTGSGASDDQVEWILECVRTLASSRDQRELLERILDRALLRTGARRGYVVLARGDRIETSAARGLELGDPGSGDAALSSSVIRAALEDGQPISTANATGDARFQGEQSVRHLQLRSVLCVPFHDQGLVRGAIYVDHDRAEARFDDEDVRALQALADPAAIALNQLEERTRIEQLNRRLEERVELQASELALTRQVLEQRGEPRPLPGVIGRSPAMKALASMVGRLAPTDLPVVVTGPSGSGKELIARALHHRSHRSDGPLIAENMAALPEALQEAELFGARRGAYTGATEDRDGLFARADGGTLFLDEIAEMPLPLQAKLLRVLETGEVRPLGSDRVQAVSVRIVAATHRDLAERVRAGAFRQDLFYRLDGGELRLPPLEERLEDIELLVAHFVAELDRESGVQKAVAPELLAALVRRPWPGQVRELRNEVTRLWHLSGPALDDPSLVRAPARTAREEDGAETESLLLVDAERRAIERALAASEGRKEQAARLLGISRSGLYTKLARLGLE